MSEDKKKEGPLNNPKVKVDVVPKEGRNPDHKKEAEKVKEKLTEKINKAVSDSKSGGKEKQFDAAEAETKKAAEGVDGKKVDKIKVSVEGTDKDGHDVSKGWGVKPKEGK